MHFEPVRREDVGHQLPFIVTIFDDEQTLVGNGVSRMLEMSHLAINYINTLKQRLQSRFGIDGFPLPKSALQGSDT